MTCPFVRLEYIIIILISLVELLSNLDLGSVLYGKFALKTVFAVVNLIESEISAQTFIQ